MESPPDPVLVADGVSMIDTHMAGQAQLNAVYVIASHEPALVETGPGADEARVSDGLARSGLHPDDLAHVAVTHIHIDHAGGAGALLRRFPKATLWVHEVGASHVVDPSRLIASTARTYGEERMRAFYGDTLPVPGDRVRTVTDGDSIELGDRHLSVLHTPGHASHHIAFLDDASGAMFTGEAIGSHLPWAHCFRPALPPPEVDVDAALASIRRMQERDPTLLLTSHFGPVPPQEGFARGAERIGSWAETVRNHLVADPTCEADDLVPILTDQARDEYERDSGAPFDLGRYDAIGSIRMNAQGLTRYWRKRWEAERSRSVPEPQES